MTAFKRTERHIFEGMLILITLGLTFMLFRMGAYKMVVLNLFFLPVVLSGYFLGRTSAGTLALLSVLFATIVTTLGAGGLAAYDTPVMVGLALTVWGATLGLTAILVGTLCDERAKTVEELHAAYVGVVEVLSRYLQSANPEVRAQSLRTSDLCQSVATEMRLPRKQVDDVRVASMLHDLGNVEITTQLFSRAVGTLQANPDTTESYTFSGMELVRSLGPVLQGAVPLLISQDDAARDCLEPQDEHDVSDVPIGASIIRSVRTFVAQSQDEAHVSTDVVRTLVREMRQDVAGTHDATVLDAMERCLLRESAPAARQAVHA